MVKEPLSQLELYKITSTSILSMMVCSRLFPDSVVAEYFFLAVPQYITMMYMDYASYLYAVLTLALLLPRRQSKTEAQAKVDGGLTSMVDCGRYIIISCVVIAIFAADFPHYDAQSHKLGKSMDYGLQLMDIGVGSFVFNAGFFAPKTSLRRKMRNISQSLLLGFVRFFSKAYCKLDVDEREFGTHLNFFFLLAILNLLSICLETSFDFEVGMGLCLAHEGLLKYAGLEDLLYNTTRSNLFWANIEGLSFIMPQFGMFLIAGSFGRSIFSSRSKKPLLVYWAISVVTLAIGIRFSLPNRRLHNFTFCMVIVVLHTTICIISYFLERLAGSRSDVGLRRFASRHLLFVLLWANFLVFIRRLVVDTKRTSSTTNHLLFLTYFALVLLVPAWFRRPPSILSREPCADVSKAKYK